SKRRKPDPAPRTKAEALARVAALERRARRLDQQLATATRRAEDAARESAAAWQARAEALEQQAATAEILRVISQSPADIQPVCEALLQRAVRLCAAGYAALFRFDGSQIHLAASHNLPAGDLTSISREYPMSATRSKLSGRAILSREVAQVADVLADPE